MDLNSLRERKVEEEFLPGEQSDEILCNVDVLNEWPDTFPDTTLDHSQLRATQDIVSKRLAIIQGPPG